MELRSTSDLRISIWSHSNWASSMFRDTNGSSRICWRAPLASTLRYWLLRRMIRSCRKPVSIWQSCGCLEFGTGWWRLRNAIELNRLGSTWLKTISAVSLREHFWKVPRSYVRPCPSDGSAQGLDELRAAIRSVCEQVTQISQTELFRLPVDRAFSVQGLGTVVTGTVWSRSVERGRRN